MRESAFVQFFTEMKEELVGIVEVLGMERLQPYWTFSCFVHDSAKNPLAAGELAAC